jgi:hypothetical protein
MKTQGKTKKQQFNFGISGILPEINPEVCLPCPILDRFREGLPKHHKISEGQNNEKRIMNIEQGMSNDEVLTSALSIFRTFSPLIVLGLIQA